LHNGTSLEGTEFAVCRQGRMQKQKIIRHIEYIDNRLSIIDMTDGSKFKFTISNRYIILI